MRIVNRKDFLALPVGTIFSKYEPCIFEGLCIKEESRFFDGLDDGCCHDDFYFISIDDSIFGADSGDRIDRLTKMEKQGTSYPVELDLIGRDALFEKDQLFAIWEKQDLIELSKVVAKAIAVSQ